MKWIFLIASYWGAWRVGFLWEDFAWLYRLQLTPHWTSFFEPVAQVYYRPLSVNLPYWLWAEHPVLWRAVAFGIWLGGGWFFARFASENGEDRLYWSLLWLISPLHYFGLLYFNAFDYVLFPFLTLAFLVSLRWKTPVGSIAIFVAALGSKEMAFLFPVFAWIDTFCWKRSHIRAWVVSLIAVSIFLWRAIETKGVAVGFSFSPMDWFRNAGMLFQQLYWPKAILERPEGFAPTWGWHVCVIGISVLAIFGVKEVLRDAEKRRRALWLGWLTISVVVPLVASQQVYFTWIALQVWIFLLPLLGGLIPRKQRKLAVLLLVVSLGLFPFLTRSWVHAMDLRSQVQHRFVSEVADWQKRCNQTIAVAGAEELLFTPMIAEQVYWGLLWKGAKEVRFVSHDAAARNSALPQGPVWISPEAGKGLPTLDLRLKFVTMGKVRERDFDIVPKGAACNARNPRSMAQ